MSKDSKFVKIPDDKINHVWIVSDDSLSTDKDSANVSPDFYQDSGTPIDESGEDMIYSHTEIEKVVVDIELRNGVAHVSKNCPKYVEIRIINHDNKTR